MNQIRATKKQLSTYISMLKEEAKQICCNVELADAKKEIANLNAIAKSFNKNYNELDEDLIKELING